MGYNPVLDSTRPLIENPTYVTINSDRLLEVAENYATQDLDVPKWDNEWYPTALDNQTVDFMFVMNTQNFQFTNFEKDQKYTVQGSKFPLAGSSGMQMSLLKAVEKNPEVLTGKYLADISRKDMREMFTDDTGMVIPMFEERLSIFHEVGKVLNEKYDDHFYNLVESCNNQLFNEGAGLVEVLTREMPSFRDFQTLPDWSKAHFNKRAQLAPMMLSGKFQGTGQFEFTDMDQFTVCADYVLPNTLRGEGVLVYEATLADRIDNKVLIPKHSLEEGEIRASTVQASDRMTRIINIIRTGEGKKPIGAREIDYQLWKQRKSSKAPDHRTETTAY